MENELQKFLRLTGTDEVQAMNFLQACGAISDNCVTAGDVSEPDVERALDFLRVGNAGDQPPRK